MSLTRSMHLAQPHLGVPSNLRGSLQVLMWPKGLNRDMTSLRVASKAILRTMSLVLCLAASSLEAIRDGALEALCLLSCSTSWCLSSLEPCRHARAFECSLSMLNTATSASQDS